MFKSLAVALGLLVWGLCPGSAFGYATETLFMDVAVVGGANPSAVLTWESGHPTNATFEIYRRTLGEVPNTSWILRGTVGYPFCSFADTGLTSGVTYEYKVYRPYFFYNSISYDAATCYTLVSVNSPLEDSRGTVLLVVDSTVTNELAGELAQLEMDMAGDGWGVERLNFSRHAPGSRSHEVLKSAIKAAVSNNPAITTLYLFGHLPLVFSGEPAPDGHESRAHEADVYYADLDGTWTDNTTSNTATPPNIPGDGWYDQSIAPSRLELAGGRVDFATMHNFRKHETEYLRDYIHKSHTWRQGLRPVRYRNLFGNGAFGYCHYEQDWMIPMVGWNNFALSLLQPTLNTEEYLWAAAGTSALNPGYFATRDTRMIFGINFLSYKQTWSRPNNEIRAMITRPDWGMGVVWGARPPWAMHVMAAGKPAAYGTLRTQNGYYDSGNYFPDWGGWVCGVWVEYLGDPTIRLQPVAAPGGLTATNGAGGAILNWTASTASGLAGYHVYRSASRLGPYTRLTSIPLASSTLTYKDATAPAGIVYYQVRAVVLTTVPTGTFFNQSQATFARLNADGSCNRAPVAAPFALTAKKNSPTYFTFAGSDPDGDRVTPLLTQNPAHGQIRWEKGQPYYVSATDYTGSDSFTYRLSDGVTCGETTTVSVTVNDTGNSLLAWDFPEPALAGAQILSNTWQVTGVQGSALTLGAGVSESTTTATTSDGLGVTGLNNGSLDTTRYIGWTAAPAAGYTLALDRLFIGIWSATSAVQYELRLSTNAFASSVTVPLLGGSNIAAWVGTSPYDMTGAYLRNQGVPHSANLAVVPGLDALAGTAEFRLYFWGAADGASVAGVGKITDAMDTNVSPVAVDAIEDIVVSGTASYSAGTVGISVVSTSVVESAGSVVIAVARTGGSSGAASVDYAVVDGTALAGSDYTTTNGTLTWADGDAAVKTLSIPVLDDPDFESTETCTVTLSNAAGAALGAAGATLTIIDNDATNLAPVIAVVTPLTAGAVYLPTNTSLMLLDTTVTDDGLPGAGLTTTWSQVGGVGAVTFSASNAPDTAVAFSTNGSYVLRLTAGDGALATTRDFSVVVGPVMSDGPTNGMILRYKFDEGRGSSVLDTAPGAVHSTGVMGAKWTALGKFNGAYHDSSTNKPLSFIPINQSDLNFDPLTNDFTLSFWFKFGSTVPVGYYTFLGKQMTSPSTIYQYMIWTPGNLSQFQFFMGNAGQRLTVPSPMNDDQWHLVTLVNAATGGVQKFTLYYDDGVGTGKASTPTATGAGGRVVNPLYMFPGLGAGGMGLMDDFRIYNRGLLPAEISQLYSNVQANTAPLVSIANPPLAAIGVPCSLVGTMSDDGLPVGGVRMFAWSKVSGPGSVSFVAPGSLATAAYFDTVGSYVVRLTVSDGAVTVYDEKTVTVSATPMPEIEIQGNGVPITSGDLTPEVIDYTDYGTLTMPSGSLVRTFTIMNLGSADLNLTGTPAVVVGGANAADFSVTMQPGGVVALSSAVTFQVTFVPLAEGVRAATLSVANDDADENPYAFAIQGVGRMPAPEMEVQGNGISITSGDVTPTGSDHTQFFYAAVSNSTVERVFTIRNLGDGVLSLTGTPVVAVTGANPEDFTVNVQPGATVAASSSTTFRVTFAPLAAGTRTATISIANIDSDENPYTFMVGGTATIPAPSIALYGNNYFIMYQSMTPTTNNGTEFGSVNVASGSVTHTFEIWNFGDATLNLTGTPVVALSGGNPGDFTVSLLPSNAVAAGDMTTFDVTFDPLATGLRGAIVTIDSDDEYSSPFYFGIQGTGTAPPTPQPEIDIQGNGVSIVTGDATPSAADFTDFGSMLSASGAVVRTFTILNLGTATLNLTGTPVVAVSGANAADFVVTAPPASTVAASSSTTFQVTFDPSITGLCSAALSVANDDTNENPYVFSIQGAGTVPGVAPTSSLVRTYFWGGGNADIANGTLLPTALTNLAGVWKTNTMNWATDINGTAYTNWPGAGLENQACLGWKASQWTANQVATITQSVDMTVNRLAVNLAETNIIAATVMLTATSPVSLTLNGRDPAIWFQDKAAKILQLEPNVRLAGSNGFTRTGGGELYFKSDSPGLTGDVTIRQGYTYLNYSSMNGVGRFTLLSPGGFYVNNITGGAKDLLGDSTGINFSGGLLYYRGARNATAPSVETIGHLRLEGGGTLDLATAYSAGALNPQLILGDATAGIHRGNDGKGCLRIGVTTADGVTNNVIVQNGISTNVILPWMVTSRAQPLQLDGSKIITPVATTVAPGDVSTWASGAINTRLEGLSYSGTITNNLAVDTIGMLGALTSAQTITLGSGVVLTLNKGQLARGSAGGNFNYIFTGGKITSGIPELYLMAWDSAGVGAPVTIQSEITGANDVIICGNATMIWSGTPANTYIGTTYHMGGTLNLGRSGGVAVPANLVVGPYATVNLNAHNQIAPAGDITVRKGGQIGYSIYTNVHSGTVTLEGLGRLVVANSPSTVTLNKNGTGLVMNGGILLHSSSTYGNIRVLTDVSYPANALAQAFMRADQSNVYDSAILYLTAGSAGTRTFDVGASTNVTDGRAELEICLPVNESGGAAGLIKTGAGTLGLRRTTFAMTGPVTVNGGRLVSAGASRQITRTGMSFIENSAVVHFPHNLVTDLSRTDDLVVGQPVTGAGIVANTVIASIESPSRIRLSFSPTFNGPTALTFTGGRQAMGRAVTLTGTRVNGNATITGLSSTAGLALKQPVTGTGVSGSILSIDSATQITLSANASSSGSGSITFTAGSAIGSGPVTVNGSGTLAGEGVAGPVTVASGGMVDAGITTGTVDTLYFGSDLAFNAGSTQRLDIASDTANDLFVVFGSLTNNAVIQPNLLGAYAPVEGTWVIAAYSNAFSGTMSVQAPYQVSVDGANKRVLLSKKLPSKGMLLMVK